MSAARKKSGAVRLSENAASASPRRGVSARSLAPSRLFTASVRDIKNDKIRNSPKGVGQDPSSDAEADDDEEEVIESLGETRPPPTHLLQDREEPSGAETDDCEGEDLAGAPSGEAAYRESIRVQVFTEPEFDSESELEAESEPRREPEPAPEPEPVQGLSPVSCTSDNFEDSIPPVEAEEGKRAPTHCVRSDSDTSDSESGSVRPSKVPVERRKRRSKQREVEGRASSSELCSSSLRRQKSSDSKSSDSKSSKGHRRRQSKSPKRDQKRRHQSSPDYDMATSSRSRSKSACQERNSSSRRKKHNSTSADSGDEVHVKPRRNDSRVSVDLDYSSKRPTYASTAPDYIPLNGSYQQSELFKPDTPYRMPASQTMNYRGPQGSLPVCHPSPFSPRMYSTPPQPAAPTMRPGGLFQWDTYITRDSPSSLSPLSPLVHVPNALTHHVPPPLLPQESDKRFRCLQNLHYPPKPNFNGFQLIGDSMLLRFSQQLLGENAIMAESLRFLGYCVSGQTVGELLKRLRSGFYHLGKKVVLMIGTNDLLKSTHLQQMCTELRRVVELLQESVEELIVLTIPPVPRLENLTYHWKRLNTYNEFIKGLSDKDSGISVHDISPQYILTQEELEEAELLAEFNAESPFCRGCLTCMEDGVDWDYSGHSDEDDNFDSAMLTRVFISPSPPVVKPVDICKLFEDRRISRCRMECFETFFSDSKRKDMIHLNRKGLTVVRDELYKAI